MGFLDQAVSSFFSLGSTRSIDTITGFITISESTNDALEITQHPVQQGATITDHAFLKPTVFSATIQLAPGFLSTTSLSELYDKLLLLQSNREPFTITTPKRVYINMLFQSLGLTTDKKTENVLAISATFQEVILVSVATTTVPRSIQKQPGRTGATQNAGRKSALLSLKQGIGGLFQ